MKPKFVIARMGAQERSQAYDSILVDDVLKDIVFHITGEYEYDVVWEERRNKGRLITLETDSKIFYITLSPTNFHEARNSCFQSVPTAIGIYLDEKEKQSKECSFYFYFLPFKGNNKTSYMNFIYRVMKTAHVFFLNPEYGFGATVIEEFHSVKDLITARNELRSTNTGNRSTYITDEGTCYHIYGKTFGANQKETTLLCIALSVITDKPLKLFQIIDNESEALSDQDVKAIQKYADIYDSKGFKVMEDTMEFENDGTGSGDEEEKKLRSPKFIYNLLEKYGEKKCALCDCEIEPIIQAAHIYPVAVIKRRTDISFDDKFVMAIDKDNGLWLCENHHKLFDRGLLWFEDGNVCFSNKFTEKDIEFVEKITTVDKIENKYINEKMLTYFDLRKKEGPKIAI